MEISKIFGGRIAILLPLFVGAVFLGFFLELITVERLNLLVRLPFSITNQNENNIPYKSLLSDESIFESFSHRRTVQNGDENLEPLWKSPALFNVSNFHWVRNNKTLCGKVKGRRDSYILPILVHTARSHFAERMTIRKSWGSLLHYKKWSIRLVFLLGQAGEKDGKIKNQEEMLDKEEAYFGDLVEGNFIDSYRNLTYKHMMGYRWILNFCQNAEFVLKVDDDMFIDILQFLQWRTDDIKQSEDSKGSEPFPDLYCSTFVGTKPQRYAGYKWFTSEAEWESDYFPDYCSGWCYGITVDLIRKLYSTLDTAKFFWVDDVFATGVTMEEAKRKYKGFDPIYKHLWGKVRPLDFKNYRPICERNDMTMKRKFGVVVPVARGSNFERDMICLWNKTLYDDEILHKISKRTFGHRRNGKTRV